MSIEGLQYRLKSKKSYLGKIRREFKPGGNEYEVKDIIRYTYTAPSDELTEKTLKAIDEHNSKGYTTSGVKNYWLIKSNPYNGINTTLTTPDGQKFEMQYHTPESYKLKDKVHGMYEEWRKLPEGSEEARELNRKMFEQYKGITVPKGIERVR